MSCSLSATHHQSCHCHSCSVCKPKRRRAPESVLNAFRTTDQNVPNGTLLIASSLGPSGPQPSISYDTTTGVLTFNEAGLYLISYGFNVNGNLGDNTGAVEALQNGTPLPQSAVTFASVTTPRLYTTSFTVSAAKNDTLTLKYSGVISAFFQALLVSGVQGLSLFLTAEKIS